MTNNYKISNFRIIIFFGILFIIGIFFINKLNVRLHPSLQKTNIHIDYSWKDASPLQIDNQMTSLIENAVKELQGIEKITSYSYNGKGSIDIQPDKYTDIDALSFEIATKLRQIRDKFPKNADYPEISLNTPETEQQEEALVIYTIYAPQKSYQIKRVLEDKLLPSLKTLHNIRKIDIAGANQQEYVINYQPELLVKYNLNKQDIVKAIHQYYQKISLGILQSGKHYLHVTVTRPNKSFSPHIPLKNIDGKIIFLDQIARIRKQEQAPLYYYRVNGKTAVNLIIYPAASVNTIELAKKIDKRINKEIKRLPDNYHIEKTYDSTAYLNKELQKIYQRTLWVIIILLSFILISTFSFRYLIISLISIATNLSIAFLVYYILNIQIQLYSLAGITISFGLMIDNTIIMIDHLLKHKNRQIFIPVLASTLTTIGALLSIYLLSPEVRFNLIDFALVIIINLGISLVIALWFIPALVDLFQPQKKSFKIGQLFSTYFYLYYEKFLKVLLRFRYLSILGFILLFGLPVFMLPAHLDENTAFSTIYNQTIGSNWYQEKARPYVDKYLGGTLRLFSNYVFESSFYRDNEETKLKVLAAMERSASIKQMNEVMLQLENYLLQFPQIKTFTTKVYSGDYAMIDISFKNPNGNFPYILKSKLISKALDWGGMNWNIYGVGQGFRNSLGHNETINFQILSKGYDINELNNWIDTLKLNLLQHRRIDKVIVSSRTYPGFRPKLQYVLDINNDVLALNNLSGQEIYQKLKTNTLSLYPDTYIDINNKLFPVRLESAKQNTFDIWHLTNQPLYINYKNIRLKNITKLKKEREPEFIKKENKNYIRYLHIRYIGSKKFGKKTINKRINKLKNKLPLGYTFEIKDRNWSFDQDTIKWKQIILFIFLVILLISIVLFESIKQSLIIISIIPISFIGVFLTFYIFDYAFDQGGMASFILLSGITVNAVFYILNHFNRLKHFLHFDSSVKTYISSLKDLLFPISLTVLSTVLGFIPFLVNGQKEVFWFALGVGTIGGVIFSFIGILFYLPLLVVSKKHTG